MDELFLTELRRCCEALAARREREDISELEEKLLQDALAIVTLGEIARRDGLLALEEAMESMSGERIFPEEFRRLAGYVINGFAPEVLWTLSYTRLCSHEMATEEKLAFLIYLFGMAALQVGEKPEMLAIRMQSVLPGWLEERFLSLMEQKSKTVKQRMEQSFREGEYWTPEKKGYYVGALADRIFLEMGDREIQRLLRDVENETLARAYPKMSGAARRKLMDNLSERLAGMVFWDAEGNAYISDERAAEADAGIIGALMKLIAKGELQPPEALLRLEE